MLTPVLMTVRIPDNTSSLDISALNEAPQLPTALSSNYKNQQSLTHKITLYQIILQLAH